MKAKKTKEEMIESFDRQLRIKRGERAESPKEILENAERFINTELAFEPKVSKEHDKEERRQLVEDVQNLTDEQFETLPDVMKEKLINWRQDNPPSKNKESKVKALEDWESLQEEQRQDEELRQKKNDPVFNYSNEMLEDMEPAQEMLIRQRQHEILFPDEKDEE